jgi:hypothetical protein
MLKIKMSINENLHLPFDARNTLFYYAKKPNETSNINCMTTAANERGTS